MMTKRPKKNDHAPQFGVASEQIANPFASYTIVALPIDEVMPDPLQPRKSLQAVDGEIAPEDYDALISLADDIYRKGQLQPIVVRGIEKNKYQIIMGERRWRAVKFNQKRYGSDAGTVLAIIRDDLADENLRLAQLSENLQRVDLSDLETAAFLKNILKEYPSLKKQTLASILGKNSQYVSRILALVDPQWSHVVSTGIITYASLLEQFRALPQEAQHALIESSKKKGQALTSGDINKARSAVKKNLLAKASSDDIATTNDDVNLVDFEQYALTEIGLTSQAINEVSAFLECDSQRVGESYKYRGQVERVVPDTGRNPNQSSDVAVPAGVQILSPSPHEKREVKLTISQVRVLLEKRALSSANVMLTAMIPVDEMKKAIRLLGGDVPTDDNQLVLSLIKEVNKATLA
jgi:ParB family chromosome partitioning protein